MRLRIDAQLDYNFPQQADVLLELEVAQMPDQRLVEDKLLVGTGTPLTVVPGQQGIGRRIWTAANGRFSVSYTASVDVRRDVHDLSKLGQVPLRQLPGRVIHYLWPSRYCETERFRDTAVEIVSGRNGGAAVEALAEWARTNLSYVPGCSDSTTTAHDTYEQKKGICRDFAHVMISLARSIDIPARMVSAYAWDLDPPDFHAVVEVFLDGGWYLIDPSGLAPVEGLVRIGVGRDATDISFMTVFGGTAEFNSQSVAVERIG